MGYRPELDGVRALAIAGVLLSHTYAHWPLASWAGVDVFFVLSGYLITTLLLREQAGSGRVSLRAFYARRVWRLAPALLAAAVGAVAVGVVSPLHAVLATSYIGNFASAMHEGVLEGLSQTWSLAQEEQFYALWPLALLAVAARLPAYRLVGWLVGLAVASSTAWILILEKPGLQMHVGYLPMLRANGLLLGCATAVAIDQRMVRGSRLWAPVGVLIIAAAMPLRGLAVAPPWIVLAVVVGAAILLLGLATGDRPIARLLSVSPLPYLGRLSYSLYLWHYPVLFYAEHHGIRTGASTTVVSIGLAVLSYHFVERPFLRWHGHRVSRRAAPVKGKGLAYRAA